MIVRILTSVQSLNGKDLANHLRYNPPKWSYRYTLSEAKNCPEVPILNPEFPTPPPLPR